MRPVARQHAHPPRTNPPHTRPPHTRRRGRLGAALLAVPLLLVGCGPAPTPAPPTPSLGGAPAESPGARKRLAALTALAQDRALIAYYRLSSPQRPDRTIGVVRALDKGWRVDIPGGALDGAADISIARNSDGLYQCALPSATYHLTPACVRIGPPDTTLPANLDPRVQHAFTTWPEVLTDRHAALSVSTATPLADVRGSCFSVESTSASLSPRLDVGIYCYDDTGALTGARLSFGTLVLSGEPAAGPERITLPAPVVDQQPVEVTGPVPAPVEPADEQTGAAVG